MELAADEGLTLIGYAAEPGSPSEDALRVLASWTATTQEKQAVAEPDGVAAQPTRRKR
jgi:hypothetical protein